MYGEATSRRWGRRGLAPALLLALALMFAGCAAKAATMVGYEDHGRTIVIPRGSNLAIVLDAHPDDNLWQVESYDNNLLDFQGTRLVKLAQPSRYGGHMFRQLEYRAVGSGTTRVKLTFVSLDEFHDIADAFWVRVVIN
ncbi:hypothetical protein JW859_05255 [bacterium]|nr:hypothetical protein [bacterium]